MTKLGITIRVGAAYDSVTTSDGTTLDRSKMTRAERAKLRRVVRDIYSTFSERNK